MLRTIELTIEQLDKSFETTYENAVAVKERFWAEAKESGKVYFRGVAISRRGNSVDIYWLRIAYKRHELGPQEKPFISRIRKGRGSFPRFSRAQMGTMEPWLEDIFRRYEDEFEILRQILKENRTVRRSLERQANLAKKFEG
ncbi:conjugative transfer protein MobI(A/C) [Pseudomonas sp. JS3066]|uniref:conjugative transfer protein MobI(A/C) n=1 Tax=Pseudomonas sp. JS3066 TaxID=3090665 RepID=UPI002E7AF663|nr:conjugative transfer protein MobI(A/C) [Pseudomonas sp. JS3066]WVK91095.1 conjugative transfer protein MobI(A/C) [Pseudomonas sp. JS3066]